MEAVGFSATGRLYATTPEPAWLGSSPPLVSCLMPTHNRRKFVEQSLVYFRRQTYPHRELVIVDDGQDELPTAVAGEPQVRHLRVPPGLSIGAKRNLACREARGDILVQWDDDDWYGPHRLAAQAAPLLRGEADVSALQNTVFFDLPRWGFWCCSPAEHRRLFVADVHGGTLAYRRQVWERGGYPDLSLAEDAMFLSQALRTGARLDALPNEGHFIYVRHGRNTWQFPWIESFATSDWWRVAEVSLLQDDRDFYLAQRGLLC